MSTMYGAIDAEAGEQSGTHQAYISNGGRGDEEGPKVSRSAYGFR